VKISTGIIIVGGVAFVSIVMAMALIVITGHDLTGFSLAFGTVCTSATGFIAVLRIQRKQNEQIDIVKKQTNGTLTKLLMEKAVAEMRVSKALSKLNERDATAVLAQTLSQDQVKEALRSSNIHVTETVTAND
jgi:hypothetical protein